MTTSELNFEACGDLAEKARIIYAAFAHAADSKLPCPGLDGLALSLRIKRDTARVAVARMEKAGLIKTEWPTPRQRVVVIRATGRRTLPASNGNPAGNAAWVAAQGKYSWPKLTMTPEGFVAVVAAIGRFEDSPEARRDRGFPARLCDMPPRADAVSYGGISDAYGSAGSRRGPEFQL